MKLRCAIYTLGCRLNQAESALIVDRVRAAGYEVVPFDTPADLCIVNTCTVTGEADAKSRKAVRAFLRRNPEAFMAVIGCYSQVDAETLARIPGVDLVVGNRQKLDLMNHVRTDKNPNPVVVTGPAGDGDFRIATTENGRTIARRVNLKIQEGCGVGCSYCVVPLARGGPRSRDFDDAVAEARLLAARGAKEIVLCGINVGAYANEGHALIDVVDALNGIEGLLRLRISSIELTTIPGALIDRMNDPEHALVPFLHVPLQSGSARVLSAMRRNYTVEDAAVFLEKAARVGDICIGTDLIVGFPGETDDDFDATCRMLEDLPIAYAHVFAYSDRKRAAASKLPGKIHPDAIQSRSETLRRLSEAKWAAYCQRYVGRTLPVLFEEMENGYWRGYTPNYIRVAATSSEDLTNEAREVKLTAAAGEEMTGLIA